MLPDLLFTVTHIPDALVGNLCLYFPYCLNGFTERLQETLLDFQQLNININWNNST